QRRAGAPGRPAQGDLERAGQGGTGASRAEPPARPPAGAVGFEPEGHVLEASDPPPSPDAPVSDSGAPAPPPHSTSASTRPPGRCTRGSSARGRRARSSAVTAIFPRVSTAPPCRAGGGPWATSTSTRWLPAASASPEIAKRSGPSSIRAGRVSDQVASG